MTQANLFGTLASKVHLMNIYLATDYFLWGSKISHFKQEMSQFCEGRHGPVLSGNKAAVSVFLGLGDVVSHYTKSSIDIKMHQLFFEGGE